MHSSGKLELQPYFQRDVVWKQDDQSRFIDSLVRHMPIPSMCLSLDYKTQRWKVIDGLQRMSSIVKFLAPTEWRLSSLQDIHPSLRSKRNSDLRQGDDEQRRLYTRVEDVSIPVTVIRCDYTQRSHMLHLFTIFRRLNSRGRILVPARPWPGWRQKAEARSEYSGGRRSPPLWRVTYHYLQVRGRRRVALMRSENVSTA
jgi:hypothetical protein